MLATPYIIHDADLALYPAWQDGMPSLGPGSARDYPSPVVSSKASLTITEVRTKSLAKSHNWIGHEPNLRSEFDLSVSFPDGAFCDALSRVHSRMASGGFYILVVRFVDLLTGHWSVLRFFYVTADSDESSVDGEVLSRSVRFKSTWLQESVGTLLPPTMDPVVLGEVDWHCGSRCITALTYDPISEVWTSLPQNETGDSFTRYVNFSPVSGSTTDVAISAYLRTKNVLDGAIDLSDVLTMPMTDAEFSRFEVLDGDILLNEGQSLGLVGRASIYRGEFGQRCAMQNALLRFRAFPSTCPEFAAQAFQQCQKDGTFASIATQTTSVAHLGSSRFSALELAWPPTFAEQQRIASCLTTLDDLIAAQIQKLEALKTHKKGLMQQLFPSPEEVAGRNPIKP